MHTNELKKQAKQQGINIIEMRCTKKTTVGKTYRICVYTRVNNVDPQTGETIDKDFGTIKPVFVTKKMNVSDDGRWVIIDNYIGK
tara:strand:- start:2123 stop:2377 length:255 start_codon:yes stop_codon:yes gene_type:complete